MKIMVIDTQGERILPEYRALLPEVSIRAWPELESTRSEPCHEHGALCGWLAAAPLQAARLAGRFSEPIELVFVRIFDRQGRALAGSESYMLDAVEAERPDVVSRSWGQWDMDSPMGDWSGQVMWQEWAERFRDLHQRIGFVDVGAAGNEDECDRDSDIVYPQRLVSDLCCIVGAARRGGRVAQWSGDGEGLLCVMWGDRVYSPNMDGRWILWSGTSAAAPKFAGVAALSGLRGPALRAQVKAAASRPDDAGALTWHPKWGHGNWDLAWQHPMRLMPRELMPPPAPAGLMSLVAPIEYFEFSLIG